MKNSKKLFLLMLELLVVLMLFLIVQIYAKYLTSTEGNTAINIARWSISVNGLTVKNNSNISSAVAPIFLGNDHIASDIIAPTAEGYLDLNFNFEAADVSFKYEINTSVDPSSSVKDLVATGYSIDEGEIVTF